MVRPVMAGSSAGKSSEAVSPVPVSLFAEYSAAAVITFMLVSLGLGVLPYAKLDVV